MVAPARGLHDRMSSTWGHSRCGVQVAKARKRIVEECREIDPTNPPFSVCIMDRTRVENYKDFHLFCISDHMRLDLNKAVEVACDFVNREKNKTKVEEMFAKCVAGLLWIYVCVFMFMCVCVRAFFVWHANGRSQLVDAASDGGH